MSIIGADVIIHHFAPLFNTSTIGTVFFEEFLCYSFILRFCCSFSRGCCFHLVFRESVSRCFEVSLMLFGFEQPPTPEIISEWVPTSVPMLRDLATN